MLVGDKKLAKVVVLSGCGLNCEVETLFSFKRVGFIGDIIHINTLISNPGLLNSYNVLAIPGGFSYGDYTGAGNAMAYKLANALSKELKQFFKRDTLTIGICNGCQILLRLFEEELGVALTHNFSGNYICNWVNIEVTNSQSAWLRGLKKMFLPIAHGEGNFITKPENLNYLKTNNLIAFKYLYNPNGSIENIAALNDKTGKILLTMPHPERAFFFSQRPDWALHKEKWKRSGLPHVKEGDGFYIFKNAYKYFKGE